MSDNVVVWWLVLSFAVMTVAMLGFLHEKLEGLERRLNRLEGRRRDDDGCIAADAAFTERGDWRQ
jgi:hypothetical protein